LAPSEDPAGSLAAFMRRAQCSSAFADDGRREAERNSLADKLTVEAKVLADLKVEKAAVEASVAPSRLTSGR
jgi:hypothetical protein